jgi:outer membrane protein assembly factor BamB
MCASVSAWNIEGGKYNGAQVTFYSDQTGTVIYNDHIIDFMWQPKDIETITATYYIFSVDLKYNQTDNTLYSSSYPDGKLVAGGI